MTDSPFSQAVERFLAVVLEDNEPSEERLVVVIDGLAAAFHTTPQGEPSTGREPPELSYGVVRSLVGPRFPSLGFYASTPNPTDPMAPTQLVGDAVDDLVDIVRDLQAFSWRLQNTGPEDAYWHLRFSFETHWGQHLRELALVLHARKRLTPPGGRVSL